MLSGLVSRLAGWMRNGPPPSDGPPVGPTETRSVERGGLEETATRPTSVEDLLARDGVTKQEVLLATGLRPEEFLVAAVRHQGGRAWQSDLVDATGWSESTVSQTLGALESEGDVERRWIGRRKLVFLPEHAPDVVAASAGKRPNRPAGPPAGEWSQEGATDEAVPDGAPRVTEEERP